MPKRNNCFRGESLPCARASREDQDARSGRELHCTTLLSREGQLLFRRVAVDPALDPPKINGNWPTSLGSDARGEGLLCVVKGRGITDLFLAEIAVARHDDKLLRFRHLPD